MESPRFKHRRNASLKAPRPRRSTKVPLDAPEKSLTSDSVVPAVDSPPRCWTHSPVESSRPSFASCERDTTPSMVEGILAPVNKNFSFLLRQDVYHPLSQLDMPPAFRSEFPIFSPNESLDTSLATLECVLKQGHFLLAAHFASAILTSSTLSPTDHGSILSLFYIRLACLELTGNTLLAAQEAKALEDLSSAFYYLDNDSKTVGNTEEHVQQGRLQHIVPWPLRVLAVRLQSIGFGDSRRGIAGLYELGLEARKQISKPDIGQGERNMWKARLADLGIRVVNVLIEMGDLDAARRSLENLKGPPKDGRTEAARMALLYLKIGDVDVARKLLGSSPQVTEDFLNPLLSMAEGRYDDAVAAWKNLRQSHAGREDEALITQNLGVCLLYVGRLKESREILESLINLNHSFQSLTFNLATIYELCTERSRSLKLALTEAVSKHPKSGTTNWEKPNADFKI